jgi:hypothetical protein
LFDPGEDHGDPGHGLEKSVWADTDFERMSWHDCRLLALAFVPDDEDEFAGRLLLDLDYIVRWAGGRSPREAFTFWIAPATLVFHGVYELTGSLTQGGIVPAGLEIDAIARETVDDKLGYDRWTLQAGLELDCRAAGFRQIIRQAPLHVETQSLSLEQRGGLSFSETPFDGAAAALAATHAAHLPAEHRIDPETPAPDPGPPGPGELERVERQIAHLTFWRRVYELYLDELGAPPASEEGSRAPADLTAAAYRALGDDPGVLAQDLEHSLRMARDSAKKTTIRHAREELEHLANEIQGLTERRDHPGGTGTAPD